MKKSMLVFLIIGGIMLSGSAAAGDFYVIASPANIGTRIHSLPITIKSPGVYYLGSNLTAPGGPTAAITVIVSDVTIDLMGFTITGTNTGIGEGDGINIAGRSNVEIRNGAIVNFEGAGINGGPDDDPGSSRRIIAIRALQNGDGILLGGRSNLIAGCIASENGRYGIYAMKSTIKGNVLRANQTGIFAYDCLVIENLAIDNWSGNNISATNCDLFNNRHPEVP